MSRFGREQKQKRERQACLVSIRAVRAQGCTCSVEVSVCDWFENLPWVEAAHDDWCPLLRAVQERGSGSARSQLVVDLKGMDGVTTIEAGHDSRCGVCDGPIRKGDLIVVVDDEWCHERCEP
jgi:hypothetical protein